MGIHWNYQIEMRSCFIVEHLNVKVIRSFGDADGTLIKLLLAIGLVPHPIPASFFTVFIKCMHKSLEK